MAISVGDTVPDSELMRVGSDGPETVQTSDIFSGRSVVVFGLPGAFTGTCTAAHVPSFIRTSKALKDKGVDEIIGLSVNDPFVVQAFDEHTGASAGGVTLLADASGAFTKALGMDFDAPVVGFYGRSQRYAMYVVDGVVKVLNDGDAQGSCDIAGGETMLAAI